MIGTINRGKLDLAVQEEFDHLASQLRGLLEHVIDDDGHPIDTSDHAADVVVGSVILFAGILLPPAYLACNGQAVSRTAYRPLFQAIGTTYGAGNGTTTFNVPTLPPVGGVSYAVFAGM